MMKYLRSLLCSFVVLVVPSNVSAQSCPSEPVTVQILGSGGPFINPERASASYLLWIEGRATNAGRHRQAARICASGSHALG